MSRMHGLSERRTAGGKSARSAETAVVGGDHNAESAPSGPAAAAAGGNGAPLPIVHDLGMFQGVAGGTAAAAASAAAIGQAAVAGGEAPSAIPSAPAGQVAVAGGHAAAGIPSAPAVAGGDPVVAEASVRPRHDRHRGPRPRRCRQQPELHTAWQHGAFRSFLRQRARQCRRQRRRCRARQV
jgi:hypothetical protein